jgi:hypothetical protein
MFSAYLTVYNDWDLLGPALRSVAPYVDELVVVDGAYERMAPYLSALGHDLVRSDSRVYDALASSGIPYRVISRLWASEAEKRIAGYCACTGRIVCRVDADEVIFFDERELERFQSRGEAVAAVETPTYIAPGWIVGPAPVSGWRRLWSRPRLPRQCFMFNRDKIAADVHLNYLWLRLDSGKPVRRREIPLPVRRRPIGFNAHLTGWRTWPSADFRAESYGLHYALRNGIPWLAQLRGRAMNGLGELLDIVPAQDFREIVEASRLGIKGMIAGEFALARTPLTPAQEATFVAHYQPMLDSRVALNRRMTQSPQHFSAAWPVVIDISTRACVDAVAPDGLLLLEFEHDVASVKGELRAIMPEPPWQTVTKLEHRFEGRVVAVHVPKPADFLRRQIELRVRMRGGGPVQTFRIRTDRPSPIASFA